MIRAVVFFRAKMMAQRQCPASVAKRQSVGLGIVRSRFRNSLVPSGFSLRQENQSALLGGAVRWECSLGRALTTVRP